MGHVNNAVYLTYLEETRFHHWEACGLASGAIASPPPADARVEIDYRRAAKHGDVLSITLGVAAIGRTSFTYEYEIVDQSGALIATAKTVTVRFDYAAGTPVAISEDLKRALLKDVRA